MGGDEGKSEQSRGERRRNERMVEDIKQKVSPEESEQYEMGGND